MSHSTCDHNANKRVRSGSPATPSILDNGKRPRMDDNENTLPSSPDTTIAEVPSASGTCTSIATHHTAQTSLPEEKSHSTQPVVKKLIEHGDVTFIFPTAADERDVHFLVSADILRAASKVWKVMFTGDWKEATALRKSKSVDVPLRTDDLPAMELIFLVLHHHTQNLPSPPSLDLIVRTRNACDLYDLSHILMPWIRDWLRQYSIPKLDVVETGLYMLAAGGCCKDLSQAIRHHALATLTPDFWRQWQTHELLRDSEAEAITDNLFQEIERLALKIQSLVATVELSLRDNVDAHDLTAQGCQHCYHPGVKCEKARYHDSQQRCFADRVKCGPCNHHVRVSAFMDIARKAGLWGSTDSDKKLSASQMLKNLEESLVHGSYKCSADRNCPLQLGLQVMVRFGDLNLRTPSVATLGE